MAAFPLWRSYASTFLRPCSRPGTDGGGYAGRGPEPFLVEPLRAACQTREKNLVLSPYSIAAALSMALAGARGQTAREISQVLGQPPSPPNTTPVSPRWPRRWRSPPTRARTCSWTPIASGCSATSRSSPTSARRSTSTYRAPAATVDFIRGADAARREINSWTESQTKGRIRDLFAPAPSRPTRASCSPAPSIFTVNGNAPSSRRRLARRRSRCPRAARSRPTL